MKNKREFENLKTEQKIYALSLWREGIPISDIAKDLKKSRETIYRWIHHSDQVLASGRKRSRQAIDHNSKNKIIEAFILLKRPSMRKLQSTLQNIYLLYFSPSQLRRALMKWGLYSYEPSQVFDSLMKFQVSQKLKPKTSSDEPHAVGSSPKSLEHSSRPVV